MHHIDDSLIMINEIIIGLPRGIRSTSDPYLITALPEGDAFFLSSNRLNVRTMFFPLNVALPNVSFERSRLPIHVYGPSERRAEQTVDIK